MVDLEESLSQITTYKEYSKGYLCKCPFAPKTHPKGYDRSPSLVVWPEINFHQCYSCGKKGRIEELFLELSRLIPNTLHDELAAKWADSLWHVHHKIKDRPKREKLYLDEDILEHFPVLEDYSYIFSRGVNSEAAKWYNLRYDPRADRVVFPVRDLTGGLLGFVGRDTQRKGHFKYFFESTFVLGGEDKLQNERIVIVEGFFDVLKAWPWAQSLGLDIACCWTATLSHEHIKTLAKLDKYVFLMLDQDSAGHKGAKKFAKEYPGLFTRLEWDFKNEKGEIADVGDMTESQFRSFFNV
jgi:DNA primase